MPKPNYAFEKRQRELEKLRKKSDKAQRKTSGGNEAPAESPAAPRNVAPPAPAG